MEPGVNGRCTTRMTRRITITVLVLLLVASPAFAKGTSGVTLTGGGQEIVLEATASADSDLADLVRATHLYDVDWWQGDRHERPAGDLGPRIVAEWDFPHPVDSVIVQHLYPFAEGGPVGHVPGGQVYFDEPIVGAWHPLRPDLLEVLEQIGFDTAALESSGSSILLTVPEPVGWIIAVGAFAALLAIIAGRVRQVA